LSSRSCPEVVSRVMRGEAGYEKDVAARCRYSTRDAATFHEVLLVPSGREAHPAKLSYGHVRNIRRVVRPPSGIGDVQIHLRW